MNISIINNKNNNKNNSYNKNSCNQMTTNQQKGTDIVLVIGSGVAGCTTALEAADQGKKVIILSSSKDALKSSNSYLAQGGIIYKALNEPKEIELLSGDIQKAGAYRCDTDAVAKLSTEGPGLVDKFLLGGRNQPAVPFDRVAHNSGSDDSNDSGTLALCLEASHSRPRILHWSDQTGRAIMESLLAAIAVHPNITLRCGVTAIDLIKTVTTTTANADTTTTTNTDTTANTVNIKSQEQVRCVGALVLNASSSTSEEEVVETILADHVVLATGGCGDLYAHTSNPASARGDGVAMALRFGATVKDMQYLQFHPTTLYTPDGSNKGVECGGDKSSKKEGDWNFLLTEALRGEGALLRDPVTKELFAKSYHCDGELAPRDVVSRMIVSQMNKTGSHFVYLDVTHLGEDFLSKRFRSIFDHCLSTQGLNLGKDLIPVVPAAHYSCGGVEVDLQGQVQVLTGGVSSGLYAVGEVSCTGLHGANRLASTSLLEGIVWGHAAATAIVKDDVKEDVKDVPPPSQTEHTPSPSLEEPEDKEVVDNYDEVGEVEDEHEEYKKGEEEEGENEDENASSVSSIWLHESWARLRHIMWNKVGIVRNMQHLQQAVDEIGTLVEQSEEAFQIALATLLYKQHTKLVGVGQQMMSKKMKNKDNKTTEGTIEDDCLNEKSISDSTNSDLQLLAIKEFAIKESLGTYHRQHMQHMYLLPFQQCVITHSPQRQRPDALTVGESVGFRNACLTAHAIAKAALHNPTSAGAHYIAESTPSP